MRRLFLLLTVIAAPATALADVAPGGCTTAPTSAAPALSMAGIAVGAGLYLFLRRR